MAADRKQGFIRDVVTQVNQTLDQADRWSALDQEFSAMTTNGAKPGQPDLDTYFGPGIITLQQWNDMLVAQKALVDSVHVSATRATLYRFKGLA